MKKVHMLSVALLIFFMSGQSAYAIERTYAIQVWTGNQSIWMNNVTVHVQSDDGTWFKIAENRRGLPQVTLNDKAVGKIIKIEFTYQNKNYVKTHSVSKGIIQKIYL